MPELDPSKTAPKTQSQPNRPQSTRARASSSDSRPRISRVFSAKHPDDASAYNGGDHDTRHEETGKETEETGESEYSEKEMEQDDEDAIGAGKDEIEDVQMGVRATRDLESGASLEKKQTARSAKSAKSAKDPNLVSNFRVISRPSLAY